MKDQQQNQRENAVYLQSLGAAGTVTGSKHLLITPVMTLMVDCGLFQGIKELREKNWERLPVGASAIDALILTHAHLDHCGYIPPAGEIWLSQNDLYEPADPRSD
jgi:metallo-beta-lactamase family protein